MSRRRRRRRVTPLGLAILILFVAVLAVGVPLIGRGRRAPKAVHAQQVAAAGSEIATSATPLGDATPSVAATDAALASTAAAQLASPAVAVVPTVPPAVAPPPLRPAPKPPAPKPRRAKPQPAALPAGPSLDAYGGLATWIDIYDDKAWNDPAGAVRDMAQHGVRTLFIETANSRATFALKDPAGMRTFIRDCHARHISVVAWYLPHLQSQALDYGRIAKAIGFRTSDGQKFDSFALDIESSDVSDVAARNRAVEALSGKIRRLVGSSYPLGAIIPSPAAISKNGSSWPSFPYTALARTYDAFLPMSYYTYHVSGATAVRDDTLSNVRVLRAQPGCSKTPIHLIGGLAENSSASEVRAFVRVGSETGCAGASLYAWSGTSSGEWRELQAVKNRAASSRLYPE